MTSIIIMFLCWLLYKAGGASLLLDRFRLPEPQEARPEPVAVPEAVQTVPPELSRLELEALAAEWMKAHKIKHWYIISRTAPNETLIEIITEAERAAK